MCCAVCGADPGPACPQPGCLLLRLRVGRGLGSGGRREDRSLAGLCSARSLRTSGPANHRGGAEWGLGSGPGLGPVNAGSVRGLSGWGRGSPAASRFQSTLGSGCPSPPPAVCRERRAQAGPSVSPGGEGAWSLASAAGTSSDASLGFQGCQVTGFFLPPLPPSEGRTRLRLCLSCGLCHPGAEPAGAARRRRRPVPHLSACRAALPVGWEGRAKEFVPVVTPGRGRRVVTV